MGLTREEVLHIAQLARVGLSDEDVAKFQGCHLELANAFNLRAAFLRCGWQRVIRDLKAARDA